MNSKSLRSLFTAAAISAVTVSPFLATPATADEAATRARGTSGSVVTGDRNPGGKGLFWHDGNGAQPKNRSVIGVRDVQEDGYGVLVEVAYKDGKYYKIAGKVRDLNGAGPEIEHKVVKIPDGRKVRLTVCLNHPEGSWQCRTKYFVA
jgi:hypothetical protein